MDNKLLFMVVKKLPTIPRVVTGLALIWPHVLANLFELKYTWIFFQLDFKWKCFLKPYRRVSSVLPESNRAVNIKRFIAFANGFASAVMKSFFNCGSFDGFSKRSKCIWKAIKLHLVLASWHFSTGLFCSSAAVSPPTRSIMVSDVLLLNNYE